MHGVACWSLLKSLGLEAALQQAPHAAHAAARVLPLEALFCENRLRSVRSTSLPPRNAAKCDDRGGAVGGAAPGVT
jgi:hypothetical protein